MHPFLLLFLYCMAILLASLAGGWIPMLIKLTHRRMQLAISAVAGFMLGVAMFHMLPHALYEGLNPRHSAIAMTLGVLVMFFLERFFCFHHHDAPHDIESDPAIEHHECPHTHQHAEEHPHAQHPLGWTGATIGLTVHSVIGGIALGASVAAESLVDAHGGHAGEPVTGPWLAGLAVFLVIFLHKPFDSMTIGTLMAAGNSHSRSRHIVNALFALTIPLGVGLFYLGALFFTNEVGAITIETHVLVGYTLAFSAGTFLCIALSDLLPELQFHHHDRGKLSLALVLGLVLAFTISHFEEKYAHAGHDHTPSAPHHDDHDDHEGHEGHHH